GSGTVTSNPPGINCDPTCESEYEEGKVVTLSAGAAAGSSFSGWSGAGCSGTGTCVVTMSAAKEVTATFTLEQHALAVTASGAGSGTITSTPSGINCGPTCSAGFNHNVVVTLTATPAAGSEFKGWSGACTGTGPCEVTMSAAKAVTAEFALIPGQFQLKVTPAGNGAGTVTSNPSGISCGPNCEAEYLEGEVVTLSASAAAGSTFSGWSGAGCSGTGSCVVTISAAKEVTATFTLEQQTLTISKSGTGLGAITSTPAGIDCGSVCAAQFAPGAVVTLTAGAAAGSEFKGWGGACSGIGACEVTMSTAQSVAAIFDAAAVMPPEEKPSQPPAEAPVLSGGPRFSNNGPGGGNRLEMPVTIAGPSSDIVDFGGVAMAPDASGGAVYTKTVEGSPHVFANRYAGGKWGPPIRVDDLPYEGTQPRIAAGRKGELLVVWVSQVATVEKEIRYALYSAKLGRGATDFGPPQIVDPNVCQGIGVDPSPSATAPSQAIVAYRVVTWVFNGNKYCGNLLTTAVQTRPGDVMAEIRVARLKEDRWARLGAMNNNPEASMRPPTATNGPKVGAGVDGGAVVAWQEPDQTGTARILARRIFGTVPGQVLQASPATLDNAPVSGDVDAFSLAVTPLDQARIAMRVQPNSDGGRVRLLLNTLPAGFVVPSNNLLGAQPVFSAETTGANAIGPPGVAAYEKGGKEGQLRLAFSAGAQNRQVAVDKNGALVPVSAPGGPAAVPGAESVTALDPDGGGVVAYPALAEGSQAVAVRQEFASGAAQTGLLSGLQDGPIGQLRIGDSGSGDALIGFRQGEPGRFQIVVERVSARPSSFKVKGPKKWTKPNQVKLKWEASQSNAGQVTYSVLVGGRIVTRGLRKLSFRLRPATLGSGKRQARVLATDGAGQQLLSKKVRLLIDGEPPRLAVSVRGDEVTVRANDPDSGVKVTKTWASFGDGAKAVDGSRFKHRYASGGRYTVVVHASDKAGNRVVRRFEVRVR
ncbi:MAG TPA: PKD domain-containing protein, partial [Solirubrobacterales bacterium]|nr:PKD domain-containing protein [Solirubrobacterales bacterium]